MTRVFNLQDDKEKRQLRNEFKAKVTNPELQDLIEENLDNLYDIFADIHYKSPSISVFEITTVPLKWTNRSLN